MYRDYDTVLVDVDGFSTFELLLHPSAVTNLRTNISDRNLWNKACLIDALGPRQWLPFTVVRDVGYNSGLFGLLDDADDEYSWLSRVRRAPSAEPDYLDPFDQVFVQVMEEQGLHGEAARCVEEARGRHENWRVEKLSQFLLHEMGKWDPAWLRPGASSPVLRPVV